MIKLRRVAWSDDDVCVIGAPAAANDEGVTNALAQLRQQQQQQ